MKCSTCSKFNYTTFYNFQFCPHKYQQKFAFSNKYLIHRFVLLYLNLNFCFLSSLNDSLLNICMAINYIKSSIAKVTNRLTKNATINFVIFASVTSKCITLTIILFLSMSEQNDSNEFISFRSTFVNTTYLFCIFFIILFHNVLKLFSNINAYPTNKPKGKANSITRDK